ncbi:hypothetical protein ILUMI_04805 [Ignelater luminosus]|uniref:Tetraspanin n=1 Tax=Ignelater luminosus TaxID=2038154 RepID=A0A8K0GJ88_IGNLU|nr:hypothetical protein ILUMI_04805 [Ignelater luminosus]
MYGTLNEYGENTVVTESWDFTQERLMCCGVRDVQDWSSRKINGTEVTIGSKTFGIPKSCCSYPNCDTAYEHGCLDRITFIISECSVMLGTGAICVALVQILGIIFAHMLAKAIRRVKTTREVKRQLKRQEIYEHLICGPGEKRTPVLYAPTSSEA